MKRIVLFFLCSILCIGLNAQSEAVKAQIYTSDPLEVKELKLKNGLTVWMNEDHSQPKVFGAVVVKAGAKDCPNTGIAHYFEHMMFKGTDKIGTIDYASEKILLDSIALKYDELATTSDETKRKTIQKEINNLSIKASDFAIPNEYDRLISKYGGSGLNAGTSYDMTVYFNEFSPQYFRQWAEINSERLLNPVFRLFQSELETVYEEKNMYSDSFGNTALEKLLERFFAPHPYAYPIVGSTENLKNPRLSEMRKFFQDYYVAGNMGLIISGDFNSDEVINVLESTFGRVRAGEAPVKRVAEPAAFNGREKTDIKIPLPVVKARVIAWRGIPANHKDEAALTIATRILNNENSTGYLDKLMVEGKLMASGALSQSFNDAGLVAVAILPKLFFHSLEKAEKMVMNEVERVKRGDFSDELFSSLKLELERNYKLKLEDIDSRSQEMLVVFSQGKSWQDYLDEIRQIESLTKEDIMVVANKYFNDNFLALTKKTGNYPKDNLQKPGFAPIIPKNGEAKSKYATELASTPVMESHPRFLDFANDVKTLKLAPLATLYVTGNPINDIFSLDFEFGKGTLESKLLSPLASYLSLLGTDSLTFDQFKGRLQDIGGTIKFNAENDKFVMEVTGFDKNFNATLNLVREFTRGVKADQKKMKQIVEAKKVADKTEKESPDDIASALLEYVRYGDKSSYINRLSYAETKALKGEQLIDEFKSIMNVECNIHYCGNLPSDVVASRIKETIALDKITVASETPVYRQPKTVDGSVVYFVEVPKASQSIIYGYAPGGITSDKASRYAGALFNNYFGGSASSMVFQQIREFRSLAYRAGAKYSIPAFCHRDKQGQFVASLSTQCDKTVEAVGVLDSLIRFMPVKRERVETARQDVINEATNQYPPIRYRSSDIASLRKSGYESDPNKDLVDAVKNMGIDQIVEFYNKNVKDNKVTYLVVGSSKKIDMKKLATYGRIVKIKKNLWH
ncbi:MAG: insulinase family protein [Bacteroidales bacterium]|nr:insulinase family protein [Bacteroidales bacterium]